MIRLAGQEASIRRGEMAPFCAGMRVDKTFYSSEGQAGRPALLILAGALPPASVVDLLQACRLRADAFVAASADIVLLVDGQREHVAAYGEDPFASHTVYCMSEFFARCGFVGLRPELIVVDRSQRVVAVAEAGEGAATISAVLECLASLPAEPMRDIGLPAPVLSIPHLLDPALCASLIDHFEGSAHSEGGMAGTDRSGLAVHKIDASKKHRRDCVLSPGEPLHEPVLRALARICLPEIKKAFQFDAAYNDRILIARYDDTGGYFKRHRDNVAASVAYRQFALSVNLNAGYEGGHLTFPEYNDHRYRPGPGGGIVFSASLLHEAMPITHGRRYVLLTFFHNAEAQARRSAAA